MMDCSKYRVGYFPVDKRYNKWVEKDHVEKPPVWCSVDMRDGNQSLVIPMSLEEKLEYYKVLLKVGFKEIEVGFPAASETEYEFLRTLINNNMIPEDVTVQVLTQCREHIIRKTFDACKGAPSAIIHFYNSVSVSQRQQVFNKSKEEIKQIAVDGAKLVKKLASEYEGNFRFEYSPESFTGTETEYALEVCNAVLDVLKPSQDNNVIINLPVTVEMSLPHVYASQVEYMSENLKYREFVTLSLHPHNDRGTGVADTELALLAGADRVEGTLFGNGERTGNVDIITLAMNMYSHGVDPKLDMSDMNELVETYERCTRMHVYERAPYAGALVFAAFSGSHQDAIAKGMKYRAKNRLHEWSVPYIPIDPKDIGRTYDADVIRVNSQSGKGGIGYLLEQTFGYNLPAKMREHFSYMCKSVSDHEHKELKPDEVLDIFTANYLNLNSGIEVTDFDFMRENDAVKINITFRRNGEETELEAEGNGTLSAVNNALCEFTGEEYTLQVFTQHSMQGDGSHSVAASYIGLEREDGAMYWGAGTDTDVLKYNEAEIERIGRIGFETARKRNKKLCSVEKSNVLDSSRLWKKVMHRLAEEYPDVELSDMLVDNCAMQIVKNPAQFDVVVTENMFGDILSDEASMITGSIGMIPSSSLGATTCGLYEPIHGSAPDIAGQDKANPIGTILSAAMMLRFSFDMESEADTIENAVSKYLDAGYRTSDIMSEGMKLVGCKQCGDLIVSYLAKE